MRDAECTSANNSLSAPTAKHHSFYKFAKVYPVFIMRSFISIILLAVYGTFLSSPVSAQECDICGGLFLTNPDGLLQGAVSIEQCQQIVALSPEIPASACFLLGSFEGITCQALQDQGSLIPPTICPLVPQLVGDSCGCAESLEPPTAEPTAAPMSSPSPGAGGGAGIFLELIRGLIEFFRTLFGF